MDLELRDALRELGLAPGASRRDVKRARRDAARRWHPDQFHSDDAERRLAERRLTRVNDAYRFLEGRGFGTGSAPSARPVAKARPSSRPRTTRERLVAAGTTLTWWSGAALLLFIAYIAPRAGGSGASLARASTSPVFDAIGDGVSDRRASRVIDERPFDGEPFTWDGSDVSAPPPSHETGPVTETIRAPSTVHFFTLGSSQERVRAVQGAPRVEDGARWWYGFSWVDFDSDGLVAHWYDSGSLRLRARLVPNAPGPRPDHYTRGSSKDDVLRAEGSPKRFTNERWWYGYSWVDFDGETVSSWYDSGAHGLLARLVPAPGTEACSRFSIGSTKDEVLVAQGSPRRFDDAFWHYGWSWVEFSGDVVVNWYDSGEHQLRAFRTD